MHGIRSLTTSRRAREFRLKHRAEQEPALKLRSLEATMRDFERVALDLAQQIAGEEARTAHHRPGALRLLDLRHRSQDSSVQSVDPLADLSARIDSARCEHEAMTIELREMEQSENSIAIHRAQ
jgi:hypothetical protein